MADEAFPEEHGDLEHVTDGEKVDEGAKGAEEEEKVEGEHADRTQCEQEGEHIEGAQAELQEGERLEGEEGDKQEGEAVKGEQGEIQQGEHVEGEQVEADDKEKVEGEELGGELSEEEEHQPKEEPKPAEEEEQIEEEEFVEEPPPDPAAPYNFTDSQELLKAPFELRPEQLAEVEQLWELYQNYTPAYTDLDNYITEKELIYMLKALMLMTYTPEQMQEVIEYCVRPPHPEGHINFEQFLKIVTMRQRDFPVEEELRSALQVYDPEKTGLIDREFLIEALSKQGYKMPQKQLSNLIKEVDIAGDGTIGIEDVVGTMCVDLNKDDIIMMLAALQGGVPPAPPDDDDNNM